MTISKTESLSLSDLTVDKTYELCFCDTESSGIIADQLAPQCNGIYKLKNITETTSESTVQISYAVFENMSETPNTTKYIYVATPLEPALDKEGFHFKTVTFTCFKVIDFDIKVFLEDAMNPVEPRWNETNKKFEFYSVSQNEFVLSQIMNSDNYTGCILLPYNEENNNMANNDVNVMGYIAKI